MRRKLTRTLGNINGGALASILHLGGDQARTTRAANTLDGARHVGT
jgi:hypothetical protein